ncbi:hypothetical protein RIF29_19539 [Crotalaria pallida]|uniref:F-box domain-containing protein n=1 Tax=Crotalaria pallida TaxID=3830 RepID=A0AAN9F3Q3_CROPI
MGTSIVENLDILNEILLRLPVKSLMRFKCVSKQWLAHITSPCFCKSHTLCLYQTPHPFPSALLVNPFGPKYPPCLIMPSTSCDTVPFTPMVTNFHFLNVPSITLRQSCNGLLLIKGHIPNLYFVCNPITEQFVALTLPSPKDPTHDAFYLHLAFNPLRSPHYKVILIRFNDSKHYEFDINIYSSKTRCWSDFGVCLREKVWQLTNDSVVYCNGVIYWHSYFDKSLCFDVENQCFKTFPMPHDIDSFYIRYFGECGGHLHIILSPNTLTPMNFDILELKEDCSGWSLRFHVNLWELVEGYYGPTYMFAPFNVICVFRQEKEENSVLVFLLGCEVICYNLSDYTLTRLTAFYPLFVPSKNKHFVFDTIEFNSAPNFRVFQYFENLSWDGDSSTL